MNKKVRQAFVQDFGFFVLLGEYFKVYEDITVKSFLEFAKKYKKEEFNKSFDKICSQTKT